MTLFSAAYDRTFRGPLAERMRPKSLADYVGQDHIAGKSSMLIRMLQRGHLPSMILWGPPGSGKTTLAQCLAADFKAIFESVSAVLAGVKELREVIERAGQRRAQRAERTLLFVDEIHRFNKAQQDALLPYVESGLLTLIGATTENPSFEVNSALLSRCRVLVLKPLTGEQLITILKHALTDRDRGLGALRLNADKATLAAMAAAAHGDARRALTTLEISADLVDDGGTITPAEVEQAIQDRTIRYDKAGEEHYNVVSAFIKSMRGSDANASIYWMTRMLEAGEPPRFILRRMVIFASEDIGNADPRALEVAINAHRAYEFVGLPEAALAMSQAAAYLAHAPKSNASIMAYVAARKDVKQLGALPVPMKLRNATTGLMAHLGYGENYKYPHNFENHYVEETYLPDELIGREYYKRDPRIREDDTT